jgi:hypothetical protein
MAKVLKKAATGDESLLKWLLNFSITENPKFNEMPNNRIDSDGK